MKIDELLLLDPELRQYASLPEMDPLTDDDALQEAQVLDVRCDPLSGVVGILFELRQALQLREANTGVLVAGGVRELHWEASARDTTLTAWSVGSSVPRTKGSLFHLSMTLWPAPGALLSLVAESAAFFVGHVPGLAIWPPDYTKNDRSSVRESIAAWDTDFDPTAAVFLDAAPER